MLLRAMDLKQWIIGAVGLFAVMIFVLMVWPKSDRFVVVDMTRAIQSPSTMLAHSKLHEDAQLKIMKRFSALLPEIINNYGKTHQVTVISASVLASHNKADITNEVVELTISRMKHEA